MECENSQMSPQKGHGNCSNSARISWFPHLKRILPGPTCPFWGIVPGIQGAQYRTSESLCEALKPRSLPKGEEGAYFPKSFDPVPSWGPLSIQPYGYTKLGGVVPRCLHSHLLGPCCVTSNASPSPRRHRVLGPAHRD